MKYSLAERLNVLHSLGLRFDGKSYKNEKYSFTYNSIMFDSEKTWLIKVKPLYFMLIKKHIKTIFTTIKLWVVNSYYLIK